MSFMSNKFIPFVIVFFLFMVFNSCKTQNTTEKKSLSFEQGDNLKIMSYNIHHANPPDQPDVIALENIANIINEADPDLVALQEVDKFTNRSGAKINQTRRLASLTNMNGYFAKAMNYDGGEYGVAILSRFKIKDSTNLALPVDSTLEGRAGEPRALASVKIEMPGGEKIYFGSTHLDNLHKENRILQLKKILENLPDPDYPIIIAGDFNATPDSKEIQLMRDNFSSTCSDDCKPTVSAVNPTRTIDYVFYKSEAEFNINKYEVLNSKKASDHLPVIVEMQIQLIDT